MKLGIFSDIHGNLEVFEAVPEDLQRRSFASMVCLGGIGGEFAYSQECLEIVRGEHD